MSRLLLRGANDHLGGELHAGRAEIEPRQDVAAKRAHPAVSVADAGAEEEVEDAGQHRIADVAVEPGHRSGLDVVHPVAHHELGAVLELLDEARNLVEVVREVGVGHDDVVATRRVEPRQVRAAVASARLVDDACAGRSRQLGAAVVGAVVDDDHLAGEAGCARAPRASTSPTARSSPPRSGKGSPRTPGAESHLQGCSAERLSPEWSPWVPGSS